MHFRAGSFQLTSQNLDGKQKRACICSDEHAVADKKSKPTSKFLLFNFPSITMSGRNPLTDVLGGNPFSDDVNDSLIWRDIRTTDEPLFAPNHPDNNNVPIQGSVTSCRGGF